MAGSLGVLFDPSLSLGEQVASVSKNAFFHLQLAGKLYPFCMDKDLATMIHAFATSRLDYHYSLHLKLHVKTMHRLPLGQNDVVPFLCGLDHHKHIRPMLKSFHRLPVSFQYQFMALALILKASDGSHQRPNFNL